MADPVAPTPAEVDAIRNLISSYGLTQLWNGVQGLIEKGYTDANQILFMLSSDSTPEGKSYQDAFFQRFPAIKIQREENQRRMNQGLPPLPELSAAEYIGQEEAYTTAVNRFDPALASNENITQWIAGNVSPAEIKGRIAVAEDYIQNQINPEVRAELRDVYGLSDSDMVKYVLSDQKTQGQLEAEWQANLRRANVGAAARSQGFNLSDNLRDQIAMNEQGYTFGSAAAQFSDIAAQADDYGRLASISGITVNPTEDLISEQFNLAGGSSTTKLKKRLASQERARFSTSSAIGRNSLSVGGLGSQ